mgnify:CR=1 FL=1
MADADDACARGDFFEKGFDKRLMIRNWQLHSVSYQLRASLAAHKLPCLVHCAVFLVCRQNLVTRLEGQRARNHVYARCSVNDEHDVFWRRVEISCEPRPRFIHQRVCPAAKKGDRLVFELALPLLIGGKDTGRASAKRPMIEKYNIGVQEEQLAHVIASAETAGAVTHTDTPAWTSDRSVVEAARKQAERQWGRAITGALDHDMLTAL